MTKEDLEIIDCALVQLFMIFMKNLEEKQEILRVLEKVEKELKEKDIEVIDDGKGRNI